jgi:hypothetical protein
MMMAYLAYCLPTDRVIYLASKTKLTFRGVYLFIWQFANKVGNISEAILFASQLEHLEISFMMRTAN